MTTKFLLQTIYILALYVRIYSCKHNKISWLRPVWFTYYICSCIVISRNNLLTKKSFRRLNKKNALKF